MKFFCKSLVLLSTAGISLHSIEAKPLDFISDQMTQTAFQLNTSSALSSPLLESFVGENALPSQKNRLENQADEKLNASQPAFYTLDSLAQRIAQEKYPLFALYQIWNHSLTRSDDKEVSGKSPLDLLNSAETCSQEEFTSQFIALCHQLGISTRLAHTQDKNGYDFCCEEEWIYLDLNSGQFYLGLDNHTPVASDELMDDPLLVLRAKTDLYSTQIDFKQAWQALARFEIIPSQLEKSSDHSAKTNRLSFSQVQLIDDLDKTLQNDQHASLNILNESDHFDFCAPRFLLAQNENDPVEKIWWQISSDDQFSLVPSNFEQIESFKTEVTLPALSETLLNAEETYYFRVRGYGDGQWSTWSNSFAFTGSKPEPVTLIEFEKIDDNCYEIDWEREAGTSNEAIEYFVFGSNALDFIPCIYCAKQINALVDGIVTEEETNQNLIRVTKEPKIQVDGSLAYYRIVTKQNGQFSVPSSLIHVYDYDLIQPRNILQVAESENGHQVIKRFLFPASYPWTETSLPSLSSSHSLFENSLLQLHSSLIQAVNPLDFMVHIRSYTYNPHVAPEVWEKVRPYFLPENHPIKSRLDRMFSATRVIQDPQSFRRAGFKRYKPGRVSHILASAHPNLKHYFIKAFADTELGIKADWQKLVHRIEGANSIRTFIAKNNYQSIFKVPHKWLYPLPENPSPPNTSRYLRKNFLLVAENMQILEHDQNEKAYKNKMTRPLLDAIYTMFQEEGLYDSVYAFNVPFCKDGKMAPIDTEHHHRWPVPLQKMGRYLSKDMKQYWETLIRNGGPKKKAK